MKLKAFTVVLAALVGGCAIQTPVPERSSGSQKATEKVPSGYRYNMVQDRLPDNVKDVSQVPDARPKREPYSKAGNKPVYEVWGKEYRVLSSHVGFRETGYASWYGEKFHGHETSNGEIYDMYKMSAAHKNLPIPSYAKVTNLENGKEVIVRVNDRGPFHSGRVIDLSYAAAYKLDMLKKGTARVRVEGIQVYPSGAWTINDESSGGIVSTPLPSEKHDASYGQFLQVGSFVHRQGADRTLKFMKALGLSNVRIVIENNTHKVMVGPFLRRSDAQEQIATLRDEGMGYFWVK